MRRRTSVLRDPGRPCASEDFSPGRPLGGPVRRRTSVLRDPWEALCVGGFQSWEALGDPWEALCVGGLQSWEALGDPGRPCASEDFSPGTGTCTLRLHPCTLYPAPYTLHQRLSPCCLATHDVRPVGPPGGAVAPGTHKILYTSSCSLNRNFHLRNRDRQPPSVPLR